MFLCDGVLEQAMREDHIRAHQLAAAGHLVLHERSVVRAELELQLRRAPAGLAAAARGQRDRAPAPREGHVRGGERAEHALAFHVLAGWRDAKDGVALELGQPQRRAQSLGDHAKQIGEDVM